MTVFLYPGATLLLKPAVSAVLPTHDGCAAVFLSGVTPTTLALNCSTQLVLWGLLVIYDTVVFTAGTLITTADDALSCGQSHLLTPTAGVI